MHDVFAYPENEKTFMSPSKWAPFEPSNKVKTLTYIQINCKIHTTNHLIPCDISLEKKKKTVKIKRMVGTWKLLFWEEWLLNI